MSVYCHEYYPATQTFDIPILSLTMAVLTLRIVQRAVRLAVALDAELSQMMIHVLVHENGPLLRFEWAEERVPVTGAARGPLSCKAVDCCDKRGSFALELACCRIRRKQLPR